MCNVASSVEDSNVIIQSGKDSLPAGTQSKTLLSISALYQDSSTEWDIQCCSRSVNQKSCRMSIFL